MSIDVAHATHGPSVSESQDKLRGFDINRAPADARLPYGFTDFYRPLHARFTPLQQELIRKRAETLKASLAGQHPQHLPPSEAVLGEWEIALPKWALDQRNQMTGPADDAELCVKMLNSGAPGVMLDLEDSMANMWTNLERGIANVHKALRGKLTYFDRKRNQEIGIHESATVILTRARGLHISQIGGFDPGLPEETTSASLYDVCRVTFGLEASELKHPLCFYIPKSESAEEALWWADLFKSIALMKGWPVDYIKCMALVEAHPLAYQIEEFLYHLRDHILGLNLGRWDYMASLIHFNLNDAKWVLPDRNTIPHDVKFFQNLRELIPAICHRRGCLAIGGMTALFPSREDAELNTRALDGLAKDKKNEAACGMDGAWTGHPDQNQIAVAQFPEPNQLGRPTGKAAEGVDEKDSAGWKRRYPDLRPVPEDVGKKTLAGTRAAIRTAIRYRNGVLNGKGASLLDGYMEDLATDRIYRLMIAQRMKHSGAVTIVDDEKGAASPHSREAVAKLFDEELEKILADLRSHKIKDPGDEKSFTRARRISEAMVMNEEFDPI